MATIDWSQGFPRILRSDVQRRDDGSYWAPAGYDNMGAPEYRQVDDPYRGATYQDFKNEGLWTNLNDLDNSPLWQKYFASLGGGAPGVGDRAKEVYRQDPSKIYNLLTQLGGIDPYQTGYVKPQDLSALSSGGADMNQVSGLITARQQSAADNDLEDYLDQGVTTALDVGVPAVLGTAFGGLIPDAGASFGVGGADASAGATGALDTVGGSDLASLIESGTTGAEGGALEAAALNGGSALYNTGTGALASTVDGAGLSTAFNPATDYTGQAIDSALSNPISTTTEVPTGGSTVPQGGDMTQMNDLTTTSGDGGAFDMGGSTTGPGSNGTIFGGTTDNPFGAGSGIVDQIVKAASGVVSNPMELIQKALTGDGDALSKLAQIGIPAAMIAGLFENNQSPLVGPMKQAAEAAFSKAGEFGALEGPGITPSQQQAIDLAQGSGDMWKNYFDKAGALTDTATGGVTPDMINARMNPMLQGVLDPVIRDIERAAEQRRQKLRAQVAMSGNDFRTPGANRFNVEDNLLDETMLQEIGDASGKIRYDAYDKAANLAGDDLTRSLQGANLYGNLGKSSGALTANDFDMLNKAGALERQPYEDKRANLADTAKLYTGVVHGTAPALSATTPDSLLTKGVGALGALKTAKDIGIY